MGKKSQSDTVAKRQTKISTKSSNRGKNSGMVKKPRAEGGAFSRAGQHKLKTDAIVAAAAKLIYKHGVVGTSLDDVADALGITKPSVYYYIENKEHLIYLCNKRIVETQTLAIDHAMATPGSGAEKIKAFLRFYAPFVWNPKSGLPKLWHESPLKSEKRKEINEAYYEQADRIVAIIKGGMDDGSIYPHDPEIVERALVSSILWIPIWFNAKEVSYDQEELLTKLIDVFFVGLSPSIA